VASEEDALAIARAERERRKRQSVRPPETGAEGFGVPTARDKAASAFQSVTGLVNDVNAGIMSWLPQNAQEFLQGKGVGVPRDSGAMGGAARMVGASLPLMMGIPALGEAVPAVTTKAPGVMKMILNNITRTALSAPKTYFAAETAAAAGAGALGHVAAEAGAGPAGQLGAQVAGSMAGTVPAMLPRGIRAAGESIMATLAPMTREGGMVRASRQMQERAGGAQNAERLAGQMGDIPEGVTPTLCREPNFTG